MREVGWVIFDEIHYMRDKGGKNMILAIFLTPLHVEQAIS